MDDTSASRSSDSKPITFRTTIIGSGKTAAGIVVPTEVVEELGTSKRPPVRVTINGFHLPQHSGADGGPIHGRGQRREQATCQRRCRRPRGNHLGERHRTTRGLGAVRLPEALAAQPKQVAEFYDALSFSGSDEYPAAAGQTPRQPRRRSVQFRALHVDVPRWLHRRSDDDRDQGLGLDGEILHGWLGLGGSGVGSFRPSDPSARVFDEVMATGAVLVGRRTFDLAARWGG